MVTEKRKQFARSYSFNVRGNKVRVCKQFFMSMLDIGQKTVDVEIKKKNINSTQDLRVKKSPHNKTPTTIIAGVKRRIESLPTIDSHYTRKDTRRQYVISDLTIKQMYSLYREQCQTNGQRPASAHVYRTVFCEQYN
jgi:hypothetical protein